MKEISSVLIGR